MVTTTKILKRKDASSVIVAVVIAMVLVQMLPSLTGHLSGIIIGAEEGQYMSYSYPGAGWQEQYLHPVVWAALQLVLLELILWLYVTVKGALKR